MIYIIGIGAGNSDLLTFTALNTIYNMDVLVGSRRSVESIINFNKNANLNIKLDVDVDVDLKLKDKEIIYLSKNLRETLKDIAFDEKFKNKSIGILSTGDPCFSGLLKTMLSLGVNKDDITVISGISSIQVACAKLKISWDDYNILTLHGKEHNRDLLCNMVSNKQNVIFLPSEIKKDVEYLLYTANINKDNTNKNNTNKDNKNIGNLQDLKITICENLSYPNEKITTFKLVELLDKIENGLKFSYMAVCVINFE
ncbi:cobalt-precorrin-7 (C(5))-methyltransferase [Methanococcus voltae]|uniref:Precorrin-6y C5,15-methyltransferase (Decarboxylating), CbiE subunit n=1 Tax=Methanococcus voltae (strain ATCC BAA-1334 / A3) TaxID=456320 RepID=D7DT11_METV3|nr:cobalt-precorrin-7 (C(5))-methyltransferase [Methanococcus voltae]MCS3901953.1 cobalt-precorrin-7 (C5)-methyltransferase [Methanococcus voltae]